MATSLILSQDMDSVWGIKCGASAVSFTEKKLSSVASALEHALGSSIAFVQA